MKHILTLSVLSIASFLVGAVAAPESRPDVIVVPEKDAPQEAKDAPAQNPAGNNTITLGVPSTVKNLVLVFNNGKKVFIRIDKLKEIQNEKPD